jgi:hypothetical protein
MAISYYIDMQLGVIVTTFREMITDSDIRNYIETLAQESTFSPAQMHLVDCSEVRSLKVSRDFINATARKKLFSAHTKCAIVAPQDYIFGMARMFEMQQRGRVEVFRHLTEAQTWLGIGETASVMSHI